MKRSRGLPNGEERRQIVRSIPLRLVGGAERLGEALRVGMAWKRQEIAAQARAGRRRGKDAKQGRGARSLDPGDEDQALGHACLRDG